MLYCRCINLIVLAMRTYKAYEKISDCEFYYNNQSVFVSSDVKHIMLITNIVGRREVNLYIRQFLPLCPLCCVIPSFKGRTCISMPFRTIELHQLSMRYYSHFDSKGTRKF